MAAVCQSRVIMIPASTSWQTHRGRENWSEIQRVKLCARGMSTNAIAAASPSLLTSSSTMRISVAKSRRYAIQCRAVEHRHENSSPCRQMEESVTSIMADVIQHCFSKECDGMREKVVDQIGSGFAALLRVYMSVAADSSPTANKLTDTAIENGDLEQVRRLLQLTSLPFHNTYEDDLKELLNLLQPGEEEERRLTGGEVSQICERIGSDLLQCLGPLAICFPELPLWAKHRTLLLPAEVAGKVALSLLTGPNRR